MVHFEIRSLRLRAKSKSVISEKWFAKYFFENVPGPKFSFPTGGAPKNKLDVLKKYHDVL